MNPNGSLAGRLAAGAVLCLGVALSGSASAQAPSCKADLAKFCPQAKPGGGRIAACLKQSAGEASAGCKARIAEARQQK